MKIMRIKKNDNGKNKITSVKIRNIWTFNIT